MVAGLTMARRGEDRRLDSIESRRDLGIQPRVKLLRSSYTGLYPQTGVTLHSRGECEQDRTQHSPSSRYRGTSLIRKCTPLGPYRRPMPGSRGVIGGWAFSYGRGTPAGKHPTVVCAFRRNPAQRRRAQQGYLAYESPPPPRTTIGP